MKIDRVKVIAHEAFLAGVRNGGDSSPSDHDYEDIQKSILYAFETWWLQQRLEPRKLSSTQQGMLWDAYGGDPFKRIRGRSASGGAQQTITSLVRLGLVDREYKPTRLGLYHLECAMCRKVHKYGGPITGCVLR